MFSCCRNLPQNGTEFPRSAHSLKDLFQEAYLRTAIQSLSKENRPKVVAAFVPEGMSLQYDWVNSYLQP